MTKLSASIVADVTVVVTPKHWLSASLFQLQELLGKSPAGVRVLYFDERLVAGDPTSSSCAPLALRLPSLVLREAAPFASGYSLRNASVELVKTKYGLFIFNDVVPLHRFWLQELYGFGGAAPRGRALPALRLAEGAAQQHCARRGAEDRGHAHGLLLLRLAHRAARHARGPSRRGRGGAGSRCRPQGQGRGLQGLRRAQGAGLGGPSAGASALPFQFPELMVTGPHGPFALDIVFDDFSNDGKLYVQRIEDSQVTGTRAPLQPGAPRERGGRGGPLPAGAPELPGGGAGVRPARRVDAPGPGHRAHRALLTTTAPSWCRSRRWPSCTPPWACPSPRHSRSRWPSSPSRATTTAVAATRCTCARSGASSRGSCAAALWTPPCATCCGAQASWRRCRRASSCSCCSPSSPFWA